MTMAGIKPCPNIVISGIRSLLKLYCDRYKFEDHGGLHYGWGEESCCRILGACGVDNVKKLND
jgi:hypothetical protein